VTRIQKSIEVNARVSAVSALVNDWHQVPDHVESNTKSLPRTEMEQREGKSWRSVKGKKTKAGV
jgi:hypothetical protein